MKKSLLAAGLSVAALLPTPMAAAHRPDRGFEFEPLAESAIPTSTPDPAAPWMLPDGFTQELVSGETADRCGGDGLDIYGGGLNDWNDMNTVNETGRQPGRYLYRTHEVRLDSVPDATYPAGGAVSVVDLETCRARHRPGPDVDGTRRHRLDALGHRPLRGGDHRRTAVRADPRPA
ncbi:MAG: hypothetical protein R2731_20315 [Nocardioides sp.]